MKKYTLLGCLILGCVSDSRSSSDLGGLAKKLGSQCEVIPSRDTGKVDVDVTGTDFLQEVGSGRWIFIGKNMHGGSRIRVNEKVLGEIGVNPKVKSLNLIGADLEQTSLSWISHSRVESLYLAGVELNSEQIREISSCKSIKELDLRGVKLSVGAWRELTNSPVKKLYLLGTQLGEMPNDILTSFQQLEVVECHGSFIKSESIENARHMPIQIVYVSPQGGVI